MLQASATEVVVWRGHEPAPHPQALGAFDQEYAGEVIQANPKVKAPSDPDGALGGRAVAVFQHLFRLPVGYFATRAREW